MNIFDHEALFEQIGFASQQPHTQQKQQRDDSAKAAAPPQLRQPAHFSAEIEEEVSNPH